MVKDEKLKVSSFFKYDDDEELIEEYLDEEESDELEQEIEITKDDIDSCCINGDNDKNN